MRTFKLTLAYDGTDYAGWQSQPNRPTVQGAVETGLARVTGETLRTVASGRTDAGVHALGQVASFRSETRLPPEVLCRALQASVPHDISVLDCVLAADDFHPIRDAVAKRYRYFVQDGPGASLFARRYAWQYPMALDVDKMQQAAGYLRGQHDFAIFESSGSPRTSSVRTVSDLTVTVHNEMPLFHPLTTRTLEISIEADGFLYNMVRNIVGTLVEVGRGAHPHAWVADVLAAHDRRRAGPTAPPQGLFLAHVTYPEFTTTH